MPKHSVICDRLSPVLLFTHIPRSVWAHSFLSGHPGNEQHISRSGPPLLESKPVRPSSPKRPQTLQCLYFGLIHVYRLWSGGEEKRNTYVAHCRSLCSPLPLWEYQRCWAVALVHNLTNIREWNAWFGKITSVKERVGLSIYLPKITIWVVLS